MSSDWQSKMMQLTEAPLSPVSMPVLGRQPQTHSDDLVLLVLFMYEVLYLGLGSTITLLHHAGAYRTRPTSSRMTSTSNPAPDPNGSGGPEKRRSPKRKRQERGKGKEKANSDSDTENAAAMSPARLLKTRLACPFARFNSSRYFKCNTRNLADYEAMKLHVKRKHLRSDFYCPLCFTFFKNPDSKDKHIVHARTNPCPIAIGFDEIPLDEWNRIIEDKVDTCPRTSDCVVKWLWFWKRFFRHAPAPRPELVYLRDIDVEAKDFGANLEIIQSVIDRFPFGSSAEKAQRIREALQHPSPGPRQYRRYQGSNPPTLAPALADGPAPGSEQQPDAEGSHDHVLQLPAFGQLAGNPSQGLGEPLSRPALDLREPWLISPARATRASNELEAPTTRVLITMPWSPEDVRQRLRDKPIFYFSGERPKWRDIDDWVDWADMHLSVSVPQVRHHAELAEMNSRLADMTSREWDGVNLPDAPADGPEARG